MGTPNAVKHPARPAAGMLTDLVSRFAPCRWRCGFVIAWIFVAAWTGIGQSGEERVSLAPPSDWVHLKDWDRATLQSEQRQDEGMRYLLIDIQKHAGMSEMYYHFVVSMVNEQGVQDNGTFSVSFDPSYQELLLHRVRLHRGGRVIDQLDRSALKIIQPEEELAENIYNGDQSATLFLKDLRIGDVLEYDYTLRGWNPIFADHFWTRFYLQYSRSIHEQFYRLILPQAMAPMERYHNADWTPVVRSEGKWKHYRWEIPPQPALVVEDYIPFNFDPNAYMEFSNFHSWGDVVQWALPLYPDASRRMSADMAALIARWRTGQTTPEARVLAALQFVQDELRYLGIEFGSNSHKPSDPVETFERRYGDCKDKSYLLVTLLRALGIEAWPALVNTSDREGVAEHLPSPLAFNHVIVKLQVDGRTLWVDPTSSHQRGNLENRFSTPFGFALAVQGGRKDLEPIHPPRLDEPQVAVQETFTIHDYEGPVQFDVETVYRRSDANTMRETLADSDREQISEDYLNFYSNLYPNIEQSKPLEVRDDPETNVLKVIEEYRINEFWELDEDTRQWTASFYPHSVGSLLTDPRTRLRRMPLRIPHPLHRFHRITVHLPETWSVKNDSTAIEHDAFRYDYHQKAEDRTIHFEYALVTRRSEVAPDQVAGYLERLEEVGDNLGDYISRPGEDTMALSLRNINWIMVAVAILSTILLAAGGLWLCLTRRFRPPPGQPTVVSPYPELQGIGGWLILVAIGLCLSPLSMVMQIGALAGAYFPNSVWQEVAMPQGGSYHPLFGPLIMLELIGNLALLALSVITVYTFFAKRALFPKVFIAYSLFALILLVLDEILSLRIPMIAEDGDTENMRSIVQSFVQCLIWCPYMVVSRRVKATFIR